MIARMMPKSTSLTKCRICDSYLWINRLEIIEKIPFEEGLRSGYLNYTRDLNIDNYFDALYDTIAENEEDEKHIRIIIWWEYNDRKRSNQEMFINDRDKEKWENNCLALIDLLDENKQDEKLIIAELYRNLGDFNKSIEILNSINDEKLNWVKEQLIKECEKKNRWVIKLKLIKRHMH